MKRRDFIRTCAVAAGTLAVAGKTTLAVAQDAAAKPKGPFADLKLRMACPLGWFEGTHPEQFAQIAKWGFPAYEWLGPDGDIAQLKKDQDAAGLALSCIGGSGRIAPGWMVQPDDHDKCVEMFKEKLAIAKQLGVTRLIGLTGNERKGVDRKEQTKNVVKCLERLAPIAQENNVTIVLEMLNTLVDHKGYFLAKTKHGVEIMKAVNSPNVKLLFDIYHQQITEGNVIRNFSENIQHIGHFHVADNPGRKEPGTGELAYKNIFKAIAATGYDGYVALECGRQDDNTERAMQRVLDCFNWA